MAGVRESVPTYRSLLVHYDPLAAGYDEITEALARVAADSLARPVEPGGGMTAPAVEIPVSYGGADGPDLEDVARHARLAPDEVVRRHVAGEYRVAMLGFAPGFPYLVGMDPSIACPRLATPRVRVPAGSVAIADTQTGIYPYAMPGGWRLIGRTDVRLFDPLRVPPAALAPGARVRFVPASGSVPPGTRDGPIETSSPSTATREHPPHIRVVEPAFLTTVQDGGRFGFQRYGVPPSGAADPLALTDGNRAVGNHLGAAALEITAGGLELEFLVPLTFALAGAESDATLSGKAIPFGVPARASAGERIQLGRPESGWRTYLCVAGGIDVPPVLGSRSAYLPAGFGGLEGRALRAGDLLRAGAYAGGTIGSAPWGHRSVARPGGAVRIPFVPGAQWSDFSDYVRSAFEGRRWTVTHHSDRIGLRLDGDALPATGAARQFVSDGTVTGAIQVTGDGLPIVLLVDRQTTGGYPKLGAVASIALHLLGQLRADDEVSFEPISVSEAQQEWRRLWVGRA